jgi:GNAT superfamily N-acetyltransferase
MAGRIRLARGRHPGGRQGCCGELVSSPHQHSVPWSVPTYSVISEVRTLGSEVVASPVIRRGTEEDWRAVRRLHIKLALEFPLVVDVELNEVLGTPDGYWRNFVHLCALGTDQALFVAEVDATCVGIGHIRLEGSLARLVMLYVEGSNRRQGIGAALVGAQESWAHESAASDLVCHIPDASKGTPLAKKLGWQRTEDVFYTKHGLKERKWTTNKAVDVAPSTPD